MPLIRMALGLSPPSTQLFLPSLPPYQDGTVFMWNFNNGSKLREYAHADEKLEIVSVGRDE